MQRALERHGQRLKKVSQIFGRNRSHHLTLEGKVDFGPWPATEIQHGASQRFVEWSIGVAKTFDPTPLSQRFADGGT